VIAVSSGIKIFAVRHLVLSQYTRLTDRQTELQQQYRGLYYMQSHGKDWSQTATEHVYIHHSENWQNVHLCSLSKSYQNGSFYYMNAAVSKVGK